MGVSIFLLLPLFSVGVPNVLSLDDKGEALFTGLGLELDGYAIPDQVSDLYLRVTLPFDEARSAATPSNATDLWRAKAWGSTLKQGGGEKIDFQKQILSDAQAASPFELSKNPMVIEDVVYPFDLTGQDCSVVTFICIRFQAWENGPTVLFEFENGKKLERATECVPVNCTDDLCAGIYCDIPVCPEGYYIDYVGDECCPGCVPGGPLNETESEEDSSLDCGEHKNGDRWMERLDDFNCMYMSCLDGETDIAMATCKEPDCDTPRYPSDSCCPICPEPSPDRCSMDPASGRCLAYFPRYFYNSSAGACEKFIYGGCGGNDNRFEKLENCQDACAVPEPPTETRKGCASEPCLNGGECREAFGLPICSCPDGYEGSNCEIDVRVGCQLTPCQNDGNCLETFPNVYICICHGDFSGPDCSEDSYSTEEAVVPIALPEATVTEIVDVEVTTWVDDVELTTVVGEGITAVGEEEELAEEVEVTEEVEVDLTTIVDVEVELTTVVDVEVELTTIVDVEVELTTVVDVEVELTTVVDVEVELTTVVDVEVELTAIVDVEVELTTVVDVEVELTTIVDGEFVTEVDVEILEGDLTTEPVVIIVELPAAMCDGHGEGETWEPQPCERCSCVGGSIICTSPSCEVQCDEPLPGEGVCCPVCPEENICLEGSEWSPDPCTQCTCIESREICAQVKCPETGCLYPKKVAGECCRQCLSPLRARPMNIRGEVVPRIWRARRTMYPRFTLDVRTFTTSENVTGDGLWKMSIWMDSKIDGTGDRMFFKEQTLNRQQASQPLYAGQIITFSEVRVPIGGTDIDCPEEIQYYCFEFQKGDAPSIEYRFIAPRQQTSILRCIRANCVSG